jgi:hypothetical protein
MTELDKNDRLAIALLRGTPIRQRPSSTIIYGTPVVWAQVHMTETRSITKEFRYDPVPGAGNARVANEAARAWVDAMEKELGYVPAWQGRRPLTADECSGFVMVLAFALWYFGWLGVLLQFIGL